MYNFLNILVLFELPSVNNRNYILFSRCFLMTFSTQKQTSAHLVVFRIIYLEYSNRNNEKIVFNGILVPYI